MAEEKKVTPVDLTERVKLIATKEAPHHKEGEEILVAPALVDKYVKNGWAKKATKSEK